MVHFSETMVCAPLLRVLYEYSTLSQSVSRLGWNLYGTGCLPKGRRGRIYSLRDTGHADRNRLLYCWLLAAVLGCLGLALGWLGPVLDLS